MLIAFDVFKKICDISKFLSLICSLCMCHLSLNGRGMSEYQIILLRYFHPSLAFLVDIVSASFEHVQQLTVKYQ